MPRRLDAREATRLRLGLTKREIAELWDWVSKRPLTLTDSTSTHDEQVAVEIMAAFDRYRESVRRALDWEFKHPETTVDKKPCISTIAAARALNVGEFHMSNLRAKQVVVPTFVGHRAFFKRADIERMLENPMEGRERHNPLGAAFVRWVELHDAPYNDRSVPVDMQPAEASA